MIKGVIFDLDGVILSTDEYHYQAWKKLADRLKIPFDREKNNLLRGVSRMESLEIVLGGRKFSDEQKAEFAAEKNETYRALLSEMTPDDVSDDVRNTIKAVKSRGIKTAIGSSSKNTKFILERVGMIDEFDAIADGNDIKKSKPDPEVFLVAAERINLSPSECFVIEDALAGIDAASAGGFVPIAIGDAVKHPAAFKTIKRLSDILTIIDDK
ncbi:MAG: beta-phosphoglucomutase [Clostridia bacterium]|nr:beta-phosphoglucomutase [Clostridia bacterium]